MQRCYMVIGIPSINSSFFFQAEDGIRDLVRSRGLGDVYKRQLPHVREGFGNIGVRYFTRYPPHGIGKFRSRPSYILSLIHI